VSRAKLALKVRSVRFLVALVVVGAFAGTALAYFTASGTGAAAAQVGTASKVTISGGTSTSPLYPGGSGDVAVVISNPNPTAVHVPSLALDTSQGGGTGFAVDGGHSGCGLSTLSFTNQNNGGPGWNVPAKVGGTNGTLALDLANAISMGTGAASACQGGSFTVYLQVVS